MCSFKRRSISRDSNYHFDISLETWMQGGMTNQDFPDVVGWMLNHSKEIIFREVVSHENVVVLSIGGGIAHTRGHRIFSTTAY